MAKRSFKDSLRRLFLLHTLVPISILFVLFLIFMMINSRFLLINQTTDAGKKSNRRWRKSTALTLRK